MRTFKQFVGSLCLLLTFLLGLILWTSPDSYAKGGSGAAVGNAAGLQVGQVWPAGYLSENIDATIAPGLFYEYQSSEVFGVKADWFRSRHSNGLSSLSLDTIDADIKANLVYYDKLAPYAFFGMGLYFVKKTVGTTYEQANKTLFGMNFGFGADLDLSDSVFIGMEFSVHNLFSGAATLASGTTQEISGRWSGFFMHGGLRF